MTINKNVTKSNAQVAKVITLTTLKYTNVGKRKKKILRIMYKRNIFYTKAKTIIEEYMKNNTYAKIVEKPAPQPDR